MNTRDPITQFSAALAIAAALAFAASSAQSQTTTPEAKPSQPDVSKPRPPAGADTNPKTPGPSLPNDPVAAVMKSGNADTTLGRVKIRDNLYALLATADEAKTAERIKGQIEKLWNVSGSATVDLLMNRAGLATMKKKNDLALKLLDAAVDLAPDYASAWNRRAFIYYKLGNTRAAVGDLRRALALDPNNFKALENLANVFRETNQKAAALKALQRLRDVNPFAKDIDKAIETLAEDVKGRGI
ncbi:MAG: tetratricopeptide repeat protein [Pseudomonadota bacterium]